MTGRRRVRVDDRGGRREATLPAAAAPPDPETCDCPRLDASEWDEAESDWGDIAFVTGAVPAVLGVPVGFAGIRTKLAAAAAKAGATVPEDAMLLLGAGRFRRVVWLEVEGVAPGTRGVTFPGGVAWTRLVEAPWGQLRRLADETVALAQARYRRKPRRLLTWYLTCRECSHERNFETLLIAHFERQR